MRKFFAALLLLCLAACAQSSLITGYEPIRDGIKIASIANGLGISPAVTASGSPTISFSTLANGNINSTVNGSGSYTVAAPSGLTSVSWGGGCSGASTVTGFSAAGGNWSATFSTPSSTGTGCTLAITGTGSNTASTTSPGVTISGAVTFTALHTYFMSPSGSDANNGTSAGTPWLTPNHAALVCGDAIIAATGAYTSSGISVSQTPGGPCPSTSGGLSGSGGIYGVVVLCATPFACTMSYTGSGGTGGITVAANYWRFEGWNITTSGGNAGCYDAAAIASGTTQHGWIAWVNNICHNSGLGIFTADNGMNHNVPGNGLDYIAAIDNLLWNSNQRSDFPSAALVDVGMSNIDSVAGTHTIFDGNYMISNQVGAGSSAVSDLEGMMWDSFDVHGYTGQSVAKNNLIVTSSSFGFQIFQQTFNSSTLTMYVQYNTLFANNQCTPFVAGNQGEINLQLNGGFPWTINTTNNIALANVTHVGCNGGASAHVYAMLSSVKATGNSTVLNTGGGGSENIFKAISGTCPSTCDGGDNVIEFNGAPLGTNTYEDPSFANTTDLLNNQQGNPNCSGFPDVSACLGWNYGSQTATANTVIGDMIASAAGTSGKGYQPPGTCAADVLWPTWLTPAAPLAWNAGSQTITEIAGGTNHPCNL